MEPLEAPSPRTTRLESLIQEPLDVLVVGGGITGCGVTHDLTLRGLRVGLVEKGDWAAATSSASSRLVHGGLRYLEQLEFGLVRESCLERGLLLQNAAGIVWPEHFTFPVRRGDRTGLLKLAAGLGLYTLISIPRVLGLPRLVSKRTVRRYVPGIDTRRLKGGGAYLDGATDDSRLTLSVVTTALGAGALAVSRVEVLGIETSTSGVEARVLDGITGEEHAIRASMVVLCGGPFTDLLRARAGLSGSWVRPTRGSHVLVPRDKLPTDGAVIFPSSLDGRIMFLIPWPRYTVVGTTDLDASVDEAVHATRDEVRYLLDSANALTPTARLEEGDVVSTWAGLRPLLAGEGQDPSARSREERIQRDGPVWTLAGGKLTGYRWMAELLGSRLCAELGRGDPARRSPTRRARLRGAFPRPVERPGWSALAADGRPASGREPLAHAWSRRYAARTREVEGFCRRMEGGRRSLDEETLLGEVDWAVAQEDCLTATDFFFRRTDLGYGPRPTAAEAVAPVLERLAGRLGWNAERSGLERERLEAALTRVHAWRGPREAVAAS